ncbi:MAG: type III-A CRISPR-associated RAMP protein Csm3 [Leptospiraceae bacterium]|nr:MAG: type III-A CRISPR-associated RAMP protein Csm3 [Leptospiraceae bacterium]
MSTTNNKSFDKPLKGILKLKCKIIVKTGLHIGGSKESIEIGGIDNIVIKLPYYFINNEEYKDVPYIPGSSLKGKIRSLLEWVEKPANNNNPIAIEKNGKPCDCGECNICRLFGSHQSKSSVEPVRLRFDDFYPNQKTIEMWENVLEGMYTELKTENTIDRIKSSATPRHIERVIAGSIFEGYITIRIYDGDTYENTILILDKGIKMLEDDYLGGNGSRGYGRVDLKIIKTIWKPVGNYKDQEIQYEEIKEKVFNTKASA